MLVSVKIIYFKARNFKLIMVIIGRHVDVFYLLLYLSFLMTLSVTAYSSSSQTFLVRGTL
jgi:hypothetical protein